MRAFLNSKPGLVYLVRHGHSTANQKNILAGRDNSVTLSSQGREDALHLADSLKEIEFAAVFSSPLLRCLETLKPLMVGRKTKLSKRSELIEMEYGQWSGSKISTLAKKPLWKTIQSTPSQVRFPDGESFMEMNTRIVDAVQTLAIPGKNILICSHGDVIKSLITSFMGSHIDNLQKISIDPASISIVSVGQINRVLKVNQTQHLKKSNDATSKPTLGGGSGGYSK
jgi:probable phosphoglycerate mutase